MITLTESERRRARVVGAAEAAAAWGARAAAEAEHQAIADHVRAEITYAQIETGLRARLEAL